MKKKITHTLLLCATICTVAWIILNRSADAAEPQNPVQACVIDSSLACPADNCLRCANKKCDFVSTNGTHVCNATGVYTWKMFNTFPYAISAYQNGKLSTTSSNVWCHQSYSCKTGTTCVLKNVNGVDDYYCVFDPSTVQNTSAQVSSVPSGDICVTTPPPGPPVTGGGNN